MPVRRQQDHVSALPTFIPKMIAGKHGAVECPQCGGVFQVEGKRWRAPLRSSKGTLIKGRPCPYCFGTALVPPEFFPKKVGAPTRAPAQ